MVITSLPPGFRFHPTDVELVKYYLKRKVLGKKFPIEAIAEVDIYNFAPEQLQGQACLSSRDLKWYFFCPRKRKYATGDRTKRSTDCGFWKTTGKDKHIIYNGKLVGMRKSLIFHRQGREPKSERTDWVMHEYRLEDEDLKTRGVAQDAFVLCMIFQKEGRGPRNGAQYGAPYNEEEWDDDEEADLPSASVFTQELNLPDKQKLPVDIRIAGPERYCVGSTSKACPAGASQIVPSVVNLPPLAPANDIAMDEFQNICDDHLPLHGISIDDIPTASSGNGKVQNLDHVNPDGNHQAEFTVDDIFNNLDNLDASEPYMELKDFDAPLTSVNGHGPSGHYLEGDLAAFDHFLATHNFWTPIIPDDENVSGLGLKDLETPLTHVGEAGQSSEVHVDASFSDLGGSGGLGGFGTIPNPPGFAQRFHRSEVAHDADDFPSLNGCPELEMFESYVGMHQEGYGVEEGTNQEIVRYDTGAANSPINNPNLGCADACQNPGRGEERIFCCIRFLEYPVYPSSAIERPVPNTGAIFDGHALFLLYGDSSHVKAEVTFGGGGCGCTNDALSCGLEGFPFVTDCKESGSGSGRGAANCGCGILSSLVLLTLSGCYAVLTVRTCVIGDLCETFRLLFLDVLWLIGHVSVWCTCIELSVSSVSLFVLLTCPLEFVVFQVAVVLALSLPFRIQLFFKLPTSCTVCKVLQSLSVIGLS